jgi:serine-type D-Ala-D-Ala carboxypeptidase (penicillin-binding protein 5/6)
MRGLRIRRGRLVPLLFFIVLVVVAGCVLAGVALGSPATTSTTLTKAGSQVEDYQMTAADLGGFGGDPPSITSPAAIVETMDSGKVLYAHDADKRRAMASTTKIMTAILVLESGVDLDSTVKVSAKAASTWETSTWVKAGDVLTVKQLLYAMLLRSANGAAVALAENDAGSVSAFAEKMNQKAQELGMKDTHFVTPNGLDAQGHYSTAADMALLGRYAMKNKQFRQFVDTKQYTLQIKGHQSLLINNTNTLLTQYSWVNGVKTGSTPNGDYCLVSSGTKDGREVIAVVLGNEDSDARFADSGALLKFGLDQFRTVQIVDKGVTLAEASLPYQGGGKLELVTDGALEMELSADETIVTSVSIDKGIKLPVKAGEVYGHVVVKTGGQEVGRVNLAATKSFSPMTLGSKLAYFWHRLFK